MKKLVLVLCSFLMAMPAFESAEARFGFGRIIKRPLKVVRVLPRRIVHLPRRTLRIAVGAVTLGVVGVTILSGLPRRHWVEVRRRTVRVAESDPDRESKDFYEPPRTGKRVEITADPSRDAGSFRNDPDLAKALENARAGIRKPSDKASDTAKPNPGAPDDTTTFGGSKPNAAPAPTPAAKPDAATEVAEKPATTKAKKDDDKDTDLKLAEIPQDSRCRKVTTIMTSKNEPKPSDNPGATVVPTETNVALLCQTSEGKWVPTSY